MCLINRNQRQLSLGQRMRCDLAAALLHAPAVAFRNKVASLPADVTLPRDIPAYRGFPPRLIVRLLAARLSMWLTRSKAG